MYNFLFILQVYALIDVPPKAVRNVTFAHVRMVNSEAAPKKAVLISAIEMSLMLSGPMAAGGSVQAEKSASITIPVQMTSSLPVSPSQEATANSVTSVNVTGMETRYVLSISSLVKMLYFSL